MLKLYTVMSNASLSGIPTFMGRFTDRDLALAVASADPSFLEVRESSVFETAEEYNAWMKERDEKRRQEAEEHSKRQDLKKNVLAKLTQEERNLLGL